jgi:hypothetical protein
MRCGGANAITTTTTTIPPRPGAKQLGANHEAQQQEATSIILGIVAGRRQLPKPDLGACEQCCWKENSNSSNSSSNNKTGFDFDVDFESDKQAKGSSTSKPTTTSPFCNIYKQCYCEICFDVGTEWTAKEFAWRNTVH